MNEAFETALRNERAFHHLMAAAQRAISNDDWKTLSDGLREAIAISHGEDKPPMKLHIDNDTLRRQIASDPDGVEPSAGGEAPAEGGERA